MSLFHSTRKAVALTLLFGVLSAPAQQAEFRTTPAKELAANPQRFWARGVVFRDFLTESPAQRAEKIGGRKAYRFTTKVVGECFADDQIVSTLRSLNPGRDYIFTATVFSKKTGFFNKQTRYQVLVTGVMTPVQEIASISDELDSALAKLKDDNPLAQSLSILKELIGRVQQSVAALAATEQVDRALIFDPQSEHFDKLIQSARRAIAEMELETKTPGREYLVQILAALTAMKEGVQPPASLTAPPASPEPVPAAPATVEPAQQPPPLAAESKSKPNKRRKKEEAPAAPLPAPRWQIPSLEESAPEPAATPEMSEPALETPTANEADPAESLITPEPTVDETQGNDNLQQHHAQDPATSADETGAP